MTPMRNPQNAMLGPWILGEPLGRGRGWGGEEGRFSDVD